MRLSYSHFIQSGPLSSTNRLTSSEEDILQSTWPAEEQVSLEDDPTLNNRDEVYTFLLLPTFSFLSFPFFVLFFSFLFFCCLSSVLSKNLNRLKRNRQKEAQTQIAVYGAHRSLCYGNTASKHILS